MEHTGGLLGHCRKPRVGYFRSCSQFLCSFRRELSHIFYLSSISQKKFVRSTTATMSILEQIQNNDIVDIIISAAADDVFDCLNDFLDALEQNSSIQCITLQKDFIGDLRNDDRAKLLYSIGQVKNLKEITLGDGLLQINDVTKMIKNAKSLRALRLRDLVLQGIESDFDACEAALYQHGCIKEFEMEECSPAISGISVEKLSRAGQKFSTAGGPLGDSTKLNAKAALSA